MARAPSTYSGSKRPPRKEYGRPPRSSKEYDRTWRRFRSAIVQERLEEAMQSNQSPCADCASEGKEWLASGDHPWELHHEKPITTHPELKYEESNVVLLCKSHHRTRENGKEARPGTRVIVCGLPASGKTTWAQRYSREHGVAMWDMDVEARKYGMGAFGERTDEQARHLLDIRNTMMDRLSSWVVIIADVRAATRLARQHEAVVHECRVSEDERQRRIRERVAATKAATSMARVGELRRLGKVG